MRKNLSILLLSCLSIAGFGQTSKTAGQQASKTSGYPTNPNFTTPANANILENHQSPFLGKALVFQEDFDGNGPGFSAWTTIDGDGKTPAPAVSFITTGWNSIDKWGANGNFGGPAGDYAAMSTSWYSPAGTSNDWLITPQISIPAGTSTFQWDAKAQDADYPDGYKVMLAPNGGNTIADFTVELYSTAAEDPDWITRSVSTSEYAGTTVRLAFVNNSTDQFLLLVDNISLDASGPTGPAGCLTAPNGQYPSATATPTCNGSPFAVTTAAWTGEYSVVSLTAGTAYTFASSVATHLVTIGDSTGTTVLAAGIGSVTYTPTTSGTVRFYTHLAEDCTYANTSHTRSVTCGTPPPPPTYGCDQTYEGTFSLASSISADYGYAVANDFFVPKESAYYKIGSVKLLLLPIAGSGSDFSTFDINILSDSGTGTPGSVLKSYTAVTPTSVVENGALFAGYPTFDVSFDLENYELTVDPAAQKRYWITVTATSSTGQNIFWVGYQHSTTSGSATNFQSSNGGAWAPVTSTSTPGYFDNTWSIDADCGVAAVSNADKVKVQYYPNPVKDVLNITAAKTIKNVTVFNVAGQKMTNSAPLNNGQLNMSKFAPGAYLISVTFEDGRTETFKVLKH